MDNESKKADWSWLPAVMPGVQRLMADKRKAVGDAHVKECWRRGVVLREPDWFYAREGAVAVGTPFTEPEFTERALPVYTSGQALLILRDREPAHGA